MGKRKSNVSGSGNGGASSGTTGTAARRSRIRKTFLERLVFKASCMYYLGTDLAKLLQVRSAPDEVTQVARDFVPVLEKYRDRFFALRDSGWTPAEKAPKVDFQEGDRVMVIKAHLPRYDFIVGLADGTTKLVAAKFVARGKSARVVDVLVKDAVTGVTYGLVPKSQLVGA